MEYLIDDELHPGRKVSKPTFKKKIVKGKKASQRSKLSLDDEHDEAIKAPKLKLKKINKTGIPAYSKVSSTRIFRDGDSLEEDEISSSFGSKQHEDEAQTEMNAIKFNEESDEDSENAPVIENPEEIDKIMASENTSVRTAPVYSLGEFRTASLELIDKKLLEDEYNEGENKAAKQADEDLEMEDYNDYADDEPLILEAEKKRELDEDRYDYEIMSDESNDIDATGSRTSQKKHSSANPLALPDRIAALEAHIKDLSDEKEKNEAKLHNLNEELIVVYSAKQSLIANLSDN